MVLHERFVSGLRQEGECLVWTRYRDAGGYGVTSTGGRNGRHIQAHRVAAFFAGLIPDLDPAPADRSQRAFVLHACDNPACCNPAHLYVGNYSDNQHDAYNRKRANKKKGAQHANAKLSDTQVTAIRAVWCAKQRPTQKELAAEYGVSQRAISLVVRKETYA